MEDKLNHKIMVPGVITEKFCHQTALKLSKNAKGDVIRVPGFPDMYDDGSFPQQVSADTLWWSQASYVHVALVRFTICNSNEDVACVSAKYSAS